MQAEGATPRDFGLKVQSHSVLMVTSRVKMRSARTLQLSFSGQVVETVALHKNPVLLQSNLQNLRNLLGRLGRPDEKPPSETRGWAGSLWGEVGAEEVVDFLQNYRTHPQAHKVVSEVLARFIRSMMASGELTTWTVALAGGRDGETIALTDKIMIPMTIRTKRSSTSDGYSIRRLLAPRDEAVDLDDTAWEAALVATREKWRAMPHPKSEEPTMPSGPAIRRIRGLGGANVPPRPDRGLLLLYVIDPKEIDPDDKIQEGIDGIVAFGISFPDSRSGVKVEYKVTNIYWDQEFGAAD